MATDITINHFKLSACKLAPTPLRRKIRAAGNIRLKESSEAYHEHLDLKIKEVNKF